MNYSQQYITQLGYQNTSWFTYKLQSMSEYKSFSDYNLTESTRGWRAKTATSSIYSENYLIKYSKKTNCNRI